MPPSRPLPSRAQRCDVYRHSPIILFLVMSLNLTRAEASVTTAAGAKLTHALQSPGLASCHGRNACVAGWKESGGLGVEGWSSEVGVNNQYDERQ